MAFLTVEALSFTYPNKSAPALKNVGFTLEPGSLTLLLGATGSGKSTLLRLLKPELAPFGKQSGRIRYIGLPGDPTPGDVGFVQQDPNAGIVTDKVYAELAFAPENAGLTKNEVRLRVGETASYFGLRALFDRDVESLSGGEKQLLSLAAVAAADPKLLLLDEPTAMLDPIAAERFFDTLQRLRRELGLTVLLAEHRFAGIFQRADRVLALENGALTVNDDPAEAAKKLGKTALAGGLPAETRLWMGLGEPGPAPRSLSDGKALLQSRETAPLPQPTPEKAAAPLLTAKALTFYYAKNTPPAVDDVTLDIFPGRHLCILGENGAGKSTLLKLFAGLLPPFSGKVRFRDKDLKTYKRGSLYVNGVALLPQDPGALFLKDSVKADLLDAFPGKKDEAGAAIAALSDRFGITPLWDAHPLDLSGGEKQKCALVKLLLRSPAVLLLDEPTKGLDADGKRTLRETVGSLTAQGKAVVTVTHDVEFAADAADECAFLFRGQLLTRDAPRPFFAKNRFYVPAAGRLLPGALTVEEILTACGKEVAG